MRIVTFVTAFLAAGLVGAPLAADGDNLVHVVRFTDYEQGPIGSIP